jgi:flagellar hook-basal body complex protein FliE
MSVSFNAALNAYNQASKMPTSLTEKVNNENGTSGDTSGISAVGGAFVNKIGEVKDTLQTAEAVTSKSLVKQADLTDVVTSISKAEVALRTIVEVRDRLITAHQEILRMPI